MTPTLVSVVLPVYNQADHIERLVVEFQGHLERLRAPYEIVLVVNGSSDASEALCTAMAATDSRIKTFVEEKGGWGRAVRRGIAESTGDLICYTNSARTSGSDLALLLMYAIAYPNVVVKANRKIREHWYRRLGSLLYNLECRGLFDLSYWDINGTPKVFPRAFEALLKLEQNGDLIDLEFNVACRRQDYPVIEIPIFSSRRHGGGSTTNIRSAWAMYLGGYKLYRRDRRG